MRARGPRLRCGNNFGGSDVRKSQRSAARSGQHAQGSLAALCVRGCRDDRPRRSRHHLSRVRHARRRSLSRLAVPVLRRPRADRHDLCGHIPGFWWALVTAILAIVVGLALLLKPAAGIVSLTAVLTAFFIVEGVFQTAAALTYRDGIPHSWGWLLASGIADLVLAAVSWLSSSWRGPAPAGRSPAESDFSARMSAVRARG